MDVPEERKTAEERTTARTLLRPRWLVGHVLALGLVVLFMNFGFWQLDRLDERASRNELIAQRMMAEPQPLQDLLAGNANDLSALDYRRALAHGRFDPEHEVLLRSRSRSGEAGWHLLTPLVQENGRAVLVDRGWVPYRMDDPPVAGAEPAEGEVQVAGTVRQEQDPPQGRLAAFAPRDPAQGELRSAFYVDVDRLAGQIPYPLEPVYLELESQQPDRPNELPLPPERTELERGPHLSYALQWFSFALIGVVGYLLLLWRTARGH